MTLELIKIQEGVGEGNVLFHRLGEGGARGTVGPEAWPRWAHLGLAGEALSGILFLLSAQNRVGAAGLPGCQ